MADIFAVVADHTRRELLGILLRRRREGVASGDASVSELVAELALSQPTVSKHLKVLREAGLVTVREKGQHRYYRIEPDGLAGVGAWVGPFLPAAAHEPAAPAVTEATPEPAPTPEPRAASGDAARDAPGGGASGTGTPAVSTREGGVADTSAGPLAGARVATALGRLAADLAFRVRRS